MTEPREEIVKKAFLQFLNRGYKACSLKTLEQATGLTKGAFYYYFKDKKEILEAGVEREFSGIKGGRGGGGGDVWVGGQAEPHHRPGNRGGQRAARQTPGPNRPAPAEPEGTITVDSRP